MPILPAILGGASLLGRLFGGAGGGSADERARQNAFIQGQNNARTNQYGIQQNAILNALQAQEAAGLNRANLQERGALDRYGTQQAATTNATNAQSAEGLALGRMAQDRSQLGLQSARERAKQSILGSIMASGQPLALQTRGGQLPASTGGLSLANLSPTSREHGNALVEAALQAQLTGSDIPDLPQRTDFKAGILTPPEMAALPQAQDFRGGLIAPPELSGYQQPGKTETGLSLISTILGAIDALRRGGQGESPYAGRPFTYPPSEREQ